MRLVPLLLLAACSLDSGEGAGIEARPLAERSIVPTIAAERTDLAFQGSPPTALGNHPASTPKAIRASACAAPSLQIRERLDARDDQAAAGCEPVSLGPAPAAARCGEGPGAADLDRLDEAVMPLDPETEAVVRRIAHRGRSLGQRSDVFGLVGDSMTVAGSFLDPLSRSDRTLLSPAVEARIGDILAHYRGIEAVRVNGVWRDSFRAPRAAKVGARAPWALDGGAHAPLPKMVDQLAPAIALVLFGGNDAAYRIAPIAELEEGFRADLERIIEALEDRGVVPVLHTLARHGDAPGVPNCGAGHSDWRIAVHTNALSATVARVACERHLPLIDLRWALDAADFRGMSRDGVHPSSYGEGGGVIDERSLRCGYNVRSYVTMRMLSLLQPLVASP